MGNNSSTSDAEKKRKPLPIETSFNLPSPLPIWPTGGGFAKGSIDLGGLEVRQISTFNKVWASHEGGPNNMGATFFEPSQIPEGFSMLGGYSQPNKDPLFGSVLVAKDTSKGTHALKPPVDYTLVWSSETSNIKKDGNGYFWSPAPPEGYRAVGYVVTTSPAKPPLDRIRCVRSDLTDQSENKDWIWGPGKDAKASSFNVFVARPLNRGGQAMGVFVGTFGVNGGSGSGSGNLACLKNNNSFSSSMPNETQIEALVKAYSPWIYFHSDERYFPSSVKWYFTNGALLYKKGEESNPTSIDPTGSNLPQGGSPDGEYWLDLPKEEPGKEKVKKGDLQTTETYFHVKPMFGATVTDLTIWVFYPYNGPARAKVEFINIPLGKIGQHVGDWEHLTLRISNFNGELKSVYFSQHSGGTWVKASELEFQNGNKFVAFLSLNGHAFYPKPGLVLQGSGNIGIRNDTEKSDKVVNCGERCVVVSAEYLGSSSEIVEPPWLNYLRKWGPKIEYNLADELNKVEKALPGMLKTAFERFVDALPDEVLGEEGPTGPKVKGNWNGDEKD